MARRRKKILDIGRFSELLRDRGYRVTKQRLAVHTAMLTLGHATADEVLEYIEDRQKGLKVSVSSVYNILSKMADMGLYNRIQCIGSRIVFDVNPGRHIHLYDSRAQLFKEIEDDELTSLIDAQLKRRTFRGYRMDRFDLHIICHPSRKKKVQ